MYVTTNRKSVNDLYLFTEYDAWNVLEGVLPDKFPSDDRYRIITVGGRRDEDPALLETNLAGFHGRRRLPPSRRKNDADSLDKPSYTSIEGTPKRISLVPVTVNSTSKESLFIRKDGSGESINPEEHQGARRVYYDKSKTFGCGHLVALCVNDFQEAVFLQDPRGHSFDIPENAPIKDMVNRLFKGYTVYDLALNQQKDNLHSCGLLTIHSLVCFAQGEIPEEDVDIRELRGLYIPHLRQQPVGHEPLEVFNRHYR